MDNALKMGLAVGFVVGIGIVITGSSLDGLYLRESLVKWFIGLFLWCFAGWVGGTFMGMIAMMVRQFAVDVRR